MTSNYSGFQAIPLSSVLYNQDRIKDTSYACQERQRTTNLLQVFRGCIRAVTFGKDSLNYGSLKMQEERDGAEGGRGGDTAGGTDSLIPNHSKVESIMEQAL